jgi:hypothetical protein
MFEPQPKDNISYPSFAKKQEISKKQAENKQKKCRGLA